jgi:hypothetical protein
MSATRHLRLGAGLAIAVLLYTTLSRGLDSTLGSEGALTPLNMHARLRSLAEYKLRRRQSRSDSMSMQPAPIVNPSLDGSLEAALRLVLPEGPPGVLLLTFGDSGVMPALQNFIHHAAAAHAPFIVGAVDAIAFEQLAQFRSAQMQPIPSYKTPLALDSKYSLDGSNAHASSSWQRFAAMRTGEVARIVNLGYDVLHTDVDVAWLRNPAPYIACPSAADPVRSSAVRAVGEETHSASSDATHSFHDPAPINCDALWPADVAVSTDNMSPGEDSRGGVAYAIGGTLNTGILLLRGSRAAARSFATLWHQTVIARACPHTTRLDCRARCKTGSCQPDGSCAGDCNSGRCCTSDQQVLNRLVRDERLPYPGIRVPQRGTRTVRAANGNVTLGSFPLALFLHGHGYFVQRSHVPSALVDGAMDANAASKGGSSLTPYAVHATYTLDNHDGLAKAQRFRENGLWRADPPSYYEGRYLAYQPSASPKLRAALAAHAAKKASPANIAIHMLAMRSHVDELRDALALAKALNRTLILPRWTCYCDRLWSGSDDIFHFGCMYPGAQDGKFVPFVCPMDHVLSPTAWQKAGVPHRDARFVDDLVSARRMPAGSIIQEIRVGAESSAGTSAAVLPLGISDVHAASLLASYVDVPVLRLSQARGLLCGLEHDAASFNRLAARLLSPSPWCSTCFQPCSVELQQWLDAETIAHGSRGQGSNRWCAPIAHPPDDFGTAAAACPKA